jgi:hypothetical protein
MLISAAYTYLLSRITGIRFQVWALISPYVATVPRSVLLGTQSPSGQRLVVEKVYAMYKRTSLFCVPRSKQIEPLYDKQLLLHYIIEKYT